MLYRVIQELVNNTLKHAKAKNILLQINLLLGQLTIMYSDDGIGFNVNEMIESRSIGLQSTQSRVNFLNGNLIINSSQGDGVKYEIVIPIE